MISPEKFNLLFQKDLTPTIPLSDLFRKTPYLKKISPEGMPPIFVEVLGEPLVYQDPHQRIIVRFLKGYHSHLGEWYKGNSGIETKCIRIQKLGINEKGFYDVLEDKDIRDLSHGEYNKWVLEMRQKLPKCVFEKLLYKEWKRGEDLNRNRLVELRRIFG